jgi:hypothetical protein
LNIIQHPALKKGKKSHSNHHKTIKRKTIYSIASNRRVVDKLERIGKEAGRDLIQHFPGGTEENYQVIRCPGRDSIQAPAVNSCVYANGPVSRNSA